MAARGAVFFPATLPAVPDPEVTRILTAIESGDAHAAAELLPLDYEQLWRAAQLQMAGERGDHIVSATGLVHEVYLKLVGPREVPWAGRRHFYSAAAEAMRRVLLNHVRRRAWRSAASSRGSGRAISIPGKRATSRWRRA